MRVVRKMSIVAVLAVVGLLTAGLGQGVAGAADASLNVVHGIPGVDVNVCVNGAEAIPDFNPGETVVGVALPAGSYDLKIVAVGDTCADSAILEATGVALAEGKNYTAVAYLTEDGSPTLGLFRNNVTPVAKGTARLTVRHTAAAPEVDVFANGARILTDVPNGASATLRVPSGIYAAWAALAGGWRPVIGPEVLRLRSGFAYQVYAWGDGTAGYDFAVIRIPVGVR
jgi:hypothetical protein